jgi:hypothetical protein
VPKLSQLAQLADLLYRVRDEVLSRTEEGRRYTDIYYSHSTEIAGLMLGSRVLYQQGMETLEMFVPGLQALVDGQGSRATISAEQVQKAQAFLNALSAAGSPGLSQTIAREQARRPLASLAGRTFDEAWAYLSGYALSWLPPLSRTEAHAARAGSTIPVQFTITNFRGNFAADHSVTLKLFDSAGNVVVGPVGFGPTPSAGIVIQGHKYHYNLQTMGLLQGTYRLVASYNSSTPGVQATATIVLRDK